MRNIVVGPRCEIGKGTRILPFAHLESDVKIGKNCLIGPHTNLRPFTRIGDDTIFGTMSQSEGKNIIGSHVSIHTNCHITQGAAIEDWVFIGPAFVSTNTKQIVHGRDLLAKTEGPTIKFGARIGANVTTLPGITIGREALIGAGSLVTKNIPDFSIAYGRPARIAGVVPPSERFKI
jgi:UDP-2-acetamido-3-amino-2,3-dideoxy-glucuronate N-acetyltransferase